MVTQNLISNLGNSTARDMFGSLTEEELKVVNRWLRDGTWPKTGPLTQIESSIVEKLSSETFAGNASSG